MADIAKKLGVCTSAIAEAVLKKEGEDQRYFLNLAPKRAHRLPAPNWIFKTFPAHPTKFTSNQIG
jgi:hypothetical protein